MNSRRIIGLLAGGAAVAVAAAAVPAIGAPQDTRPPVKRAPLARGIGSFTPAAGNARLAAALARAGIDGNGFRFTPSDAARNGRRPVTVAVRVRSNRAPDAERVAAIPSSGEVGMTPIAYNLGVAVGWRRFAVSGDVARVDLGALPGSRQSVDLGVSYTGRRASARLKAQADQPTGNTPRLVEGDSSYAVDLGGSYALTRNLDVTAGVRYRTDEDRFRVAQDNRRDSQAVYIGTAFRF